jgi:predicted RNA-binding Zn-ribbon protein involved in translation (DUF1610 family)
MERRRQDEYEKRVAERAEHRRQYDEISVQSIHKFKCPKCGASRSTHCWNLSARNRGKKEHTANPHNERRNLLIEKMKGTK